MFPRDITSIFYTEGFNILTCRKVDEAAEELRKMIKDYVQSRYFHFVWLDTAQTASRQPQETESHAHRAQPRPPEEKPTAGGTRSKSLKQAENKKTEKKRQTRKTKREIVLAGNKYRHGILSDKREVGRPLEGLRAPSSGLRYYDKCVRMPKPYSRGSQIKDREVID